MLKKITEAMKDLVTEANFDCSTTGISLQAMVSEAPARAGDAVCDGGGCALAHSVPPLACRAPAGLEPRLPRRSAAARGWL